MDLQVIAVYFFSDEILKARNFRDDPQVKMTTAEVITVAISSALLFYGNQKRTAQYLKSHRFIPNILSESHFNRRLHRIIPDIWQMIFSTLAEYFKHSNSSQEYIVDSFPILSCENTRIFRSKIYSGKAFRGYVASKKRFFYGVKAHLLVTAKGEPVECVLAPGAENDMSVFKRFHLDIPNHSTIYADRAYNSYAHEDFLKDNDLFLIAQRKSNSKRPHNGCMRYLQEVRRKRIETAFSQITMLFPKFIHAVTRKGFELKIYLFILAYSLHLLI
jgi:Transposase DDE domain